MATKDTGGQQRGTRRAGDVDESTAEASEDVKERQDKLDEDVDSILDEIDEVLRLEPGNARALTNKAALLIALAAGVVGGWAADLTLGRRAELQAAEQHRGLLQDAATRQVELLHALKGRSGDTAVPGSAVRVRDVVLLAIAARLVRR